MDSADVRFWRKVDRTGDCWLWVAATNPYRGGYGIFCPQHGKTITAHRFAWELTHGPIPKGLSVCHTCDTPPCVRSDHLFLGTARANNRDAADKGRGNYRGARAILGDDAARTIRELRATGVSLSELARRYDVHRSTITHICSGRTYAVI